MGFLANKNGAVKVLPHPKAYLKSVNHPEPFADQGNILRELPADLEQGASEKALMLAAPIGQ